MSLDVRAGADRPPPLRLGHDGGGLDLDLGPVLDQRHHLNHGHGRKVPAHHGAIRRTQFGLARQESEFNPTAGSTAGAQAPDPSPQDAAQPPRFTDNVEVVAATPIQGLGIDRDKVPGNVQVISARANAMKNDATPGELRRFAAWVLKEFPEAELTPEGLLF